MDCSSFGRFNRSARDNGWRGLLRFGLGFRSLLCRVVIVPVLAGHDGLPLAVVDAYVPERLEAPNVPAKENVQGVLQLSVAPVTMHAFIVAVYCAPFTVPEIVYGGSGLGPKDMSHVPAVTPAALAIDSVTAPLPLLRGHDTA